MRFDSDQKNEITNKRGQTSCDGGGAWLSLGDGSKFLELLCQKEPVKVVQTSEVNLGSNVHMSSN